MLNNNNTAENVEMVVEACREGNNTCGRTVVYVEVGTTPAQCEELVKGNYEVDLGYYDGIRIYNYTMAGFKRSEDQDMDSETEAFTVYHNVVEDTDSVLATQYRKHARRNDFTYCV